MHFKIYLYFTFFNKSKFVFIYIVIYIGSQLYNIIFKKIVQFLLKKCACLNIIMIINTHYLLFFFVVYLFYRLDMK